MLHRGEARQTLPVGEWRRFDAADVQPGLFLVRGPARGEAPAYGRWQDPKVAIAAAQNCGLRLRRGTRIRELSEEHEVL